MDDNLWRLGWGSTLLGLGIVTALSIANPGTVAAQMTPAAQPPPGYGTPPPSGVPPAPAAPAAPTVLEDPLHDFTLTISPLHLIFPIVELTAEGRVGEQIGVALIVGGGRVTVASPFTEDVTFTALELGAQFRFYAVGDYDHGMQLGLEALYLYVSGDFEGGVTGSGSGVAVGPFIGYKYTAPVGFTVDVQGGVVAAGIGARASDGTRSEESNSVVVGPLLNLNLGWAF